MGAERQRASRRFQVGAAYIKRVAARKLSL